MDGLPLGKPSNNRIRNRDCRYFSAAPDNDISIGKSRTFIGIDSVRNLVRSSSGRIRKTLQNDNNEMPHDNSSIRACDLYHFCGCCCNRRDISVQECKKIRLGFIFFLGNPPE